MKLVHSPNVLATSALGITNNEESSRNLRHAEEAGDDLPHHNEAPAAAMKKDRRWRRRGGLHRLQSEEDKHHSFKDRSHSESSPRLELDDVSFARIRLPPTTECVTTDQHHSSAVVVKAFGATALVRPNHVWDRLQEATSRRDHCQTPPCCQVSIPGLSYSRFHHFLLLRRFDDQPTDSSKSEMGAIFRGWCLW